MAIAALFLVIHELVCCTAFVQGRGRLRGLCLRRRGFCAGCRGRGRAGRFRARFRGICGARCLCRGRCVTRFGRTFRGGSGAGRGRCGVAGRVRRGRGNVVEVTR